MRIFDRMIALEKDADCFGFNWETKEQILAQIESECHEVREELHKLNGSNCTEALQQEIGDLLHAVFSLCVFCKLNPTETLNGSLNKFEGRLNAVKQLSFERGLTNLSDLSFKERMDIWDDAKKQVG